LPRNDAVEAAARIDIVPNTTFNNIVLVGLMGAGKTTIGRLLARAFGRPFIDSDHEIEARTGVKVPVIFEIEGEAGFRAREAQIIAELCRRSGIVLATGGGAVLNSENRTALRASGMVIYLHAQPGDLWLRTRHDQNRPLLRGTDPEGRLVQLYAQRDPLYREVAHMVMDTGRQSPRLLAGKIEHQLLDVGNQAASPSVPQTMGDAPLPLDTALNQGESTCNEPNCASI
jgi:shikimate kinase